LLLPGGNYLTEITGEGGVKIVGAVVFADVGDAGI